MKVRSRYVLAVAALSASTGMAALNYVPVVTQVGDGTESISTALGAMTTIQVYSPGAFNSTPVAQMAYPSAAGIGGTLVNAPNSTTEGQLTNNPALADAAAAGTVFSGTAYVFSGGYSGSDGQTAVNNTSAGNNRVIGFMTVTANSVSAGTIGATETNADSFTSGNIRGAVGDDTATNFWGAGTGSGSSAGYRYFSSPSSTMLASTPTNVRSIQIRGGQIYTTSDTGTFVGIQAIGTGTPTTSGQTAHVVLTTNASSGNASPESFVFFNNPAVSDPTGVPYNVAYVADAATGATPTAPGIEKWVFNPANVSTNNGWSLAYVISDAVSAASGLSTTGYLGLAGEADGNGNAVLFGTTDVGASADGTIVTENNLEEFTDPLAATLATQGALTDASEVVLATSGAHLAFRGVALAPAAVPEPASLSLLGLGAIGLIGRRRK